MSDNTPYCGGCDAIREPNDNGNCSECGCLIYWLGIDIVPKADLRELVEQWRERENDDVDPITETMRRRRELEELLE